MTSHPSIQHWFELKLLPHSLNQLNNVDFTIISTIYKHSNPIKGIPKASVQTASHRSSSSSNNSNRVLGSRYHTHYTWIVTTFNYTDRSKKNPTAQHLYTSTNFELPDNTRVHIIQFIRSSCRIQTVGTMRKGIQRWIASSWSTLSRYCPEHNCALQSYRADPVNWPSLEFIRSPKWVLTSSFSNTTTSMAWFCSVSCQDVVSEVYRNWSESVEMKSS